MARELLAYINRPSFVHRLSGLTKLVFFLLFSTAAMVSYDTRVLLFMLIMSLIIFKLSHVKFKEIQFVFCLILLFLALNTITIYLFSPQEGVKIYGTSHVLLKGIGHYNITAEQVFYLFNVLLKYLVVTPTALLFITTTHPTEFAASLNKIGVSYRVSYAVSLALRYIPDIQRDFFAISKSQQMRGVDLSKNARLSQRLKNYAMILIPLILTSLDRIEIIANAMELRAFGKKNKRTWYSQSPLKKADYLTLVTACLLFILAIAITLTNKTRFYNPFL
ncbi:energy-coupling factor transporter transmembrane protein EcfT [Atopobacter sp. AH10]|nr:energy-coupling factor transporter transmembrane protein EcfT [Atopobacter sp. AH10]